MDSPQATLEGGELTKDLSRDGVCHGNFWYKQPGPKIVCAFVSDFTFSHCSPSALELLLLLLLTHFSRVRRCATPWAAAHQAPPSLGFSRQEHWSGLPFPSPMQESEMWKGSRSVMSDSLQPHGCGLPGSSVHGIFQARVLELGCHCLLRVRTTVVTKRFLKPKEMVNLSSTFNR